MSRLARFGLVALLSCLSANLSLSQVSGPWWNTQWHYRLPVAAGANGFARAEKVANFSVNFTTLLQTLGAGGSLNDQSVRVVEVNGSGVVIDSNVVYQFDHAENYNATTNASGIVVVQLSGTTSFSTTRYFHIYFDTGSGFTLPSFSNQLSLTDNVWYAGQSSYQVDNQLGRLWYHKIGGGFAGMRDLNNVEWIGFDPTPGSHGAGEYRGIPNMGPYAHPGYGNGSSTILNQGPIKITIKTVTTDGTNARWIWEFYPTYQTMTLLQTGVNYWLLYEGTPAGTFDLTNGYIKNSAGQTLNLGTSFAGDLPDPEWAYFGMTGQPRFLYLAHHEGDNLIDHYRAFFDVGWMTVFGFGRDGGSTNHYMSAAPQKLTFGFGENESQSAQIMDNAFRDLTIVNGNPEANVSGPAQITGQPTNKTVQVGQTASFTVGAVGSTPLSYQWQRDLVDISGATTAAYTTPATVQTDSGAQFRCIVANALGTATSNSALLRVLPGPPPPSSTIKTDDFNGGQLDLATWVFKDSVGNSTQNMTSSQLSLSVPAGSSHDLYTGQNRAPRVVQNITNIATFDVEAKFSSPMNAQYQIQGILVEQDATNLLRFAFRSDGSSTYIDAFSIMSDVATSRIDSYIGSANLAPLYMRLSRNVDAWTLSYSTDSTNWTAAGTFNHTITSTTIGVFAGNAGGSPPAFTALVDYFYNLNALPVQLGSFTGSVLSANRVRLDWMTVTETNNFGFEVQKSLRNQNIFQTIPNSFLAGHGTTLEPHYYSFIDENANAGSWKYRLKQMDLDGTINYSDPITIDILTSVSEQKPTEFLLAQNYPNPFNPTTTIRFSLPTSGFVSLKVFNGLGQEVATLVNENRSMGTYDQLFDASQLVSGVYVYRLQAGSFTASRKLVLVK